MFFNMGFYRVTIKGIRASEQEAPILALAPHSSFTDAFPVVLLTAPSLVVKSSVKNIPFFHSKYDRVLSTSQFFFYCLFFYAINLYGSLSFLNIYFFTILFCSSFPCLSVDYFILVTAWFRYFIRTLGFFSFEFQFPKLSLECRRPRPVAAADILFYFIFLLKTRFVAWPTLLFPSRRLSRAHISLSFFSRACLSQYFVNSCICTFRSINLIF